MTVIRTDRARHIHTVTAGRTGTAWLAQFIGANLGIRSVHEYLGIDDFGVRMPDIRTMRSFNEYGYSPVVDDFWKRRFAGTDTGTPYSETNHTLAKCGLLEYIDKYDPSIEFVFINLKRNWVKQISSYLQRNDFGNYTLIWQWYIDPQCRNKIAPTLPFSKFGNVGGIIWFVAEVECRQAYYKQLYGDRFRFIDATLETMTTPDGASALLRQLGGQGDPVLPGKANESRTAVNEEAVQRLQEIVEQVQFDPVAAASDYIASGKRLASPVS